MFKWLTKKTKNTKASASKMPEGFKVVAPPKNAERSKLLMAEDITTSGGCNTVHHQAVH